MEIDNWQTMMLIFEVVCEFSKNKEENLSPHLKGSDFSSKNKEE